MIISPGASGENQRSRYCTSDKIIKYVSERMRNLRTKNRGYFSSEFDERSSCFRARARAREIKMDTLTGQSGCRRDGELWPVISGLHGKFVRRQRGYNRTVRSRFGKGWNICTTEFRGRETPNEKVVGKGASERERQKEQWTPLLKSAAAKRRCDERKSDSTVADKISRKCAKHIIQSFPGIFLYRAR